MELRGKCFSRITVLGCVIIFSGSLFSLSARFAKSEIVDDADVAARAEIKICCRARNLISTGIFNYCIFFFESSLTSDPCSE